MKSLKIAILTLCAGLTLGSCDFLEKEPYELVPETYFNNAAEANSFLISVYSPLASQQFYGNYYMHLVGGSDLEHFGGARNAYSSGAIACNNATASSPLFSYLWGTLYQGVDRACTFLENIDKVPDGEISDVVREQYRSEARFLRAFYYFTLVQGWGDVPFRTTATNSVDGLSISRTDKETIYDFIVKEMDECADGLFFADIKQHNASVFSADPQVGTILRHAGQSVFCEVKRGVHYAGIVLPAAICFPGK